MVARRAEDPRRRRGAVRRSLAAVTLAAALSSSGCFSTAFLSTDYEDRTEGQWLRAFAIDLGVGAALVGTSLLVGRKGEPEPFTLSAGVISAGIAVFVMPLAGYPQTPRTPPARDPEE